MGLTSKHLDEMTLWHDYFLVFYMQGFFFVTGYCTNFNKPCGGFIYANVKGLIIPAISFTIICRCILGGIEGMNIYQSLHYIFGSIGYWFLWALFFAKILYYCVRKTFFPGIILLLLSIIAGGISIYTNIENTLFWMNTLLCAPFLYIGEKLRIYSDNMSKFFITSAIFFSLWLQY